ncbi:rhodanese-like domain-containing protein [Geodermatophilus sp. SYSU D00758]
MTADAVPPGAVPPGAVPPGAVPPDSRPARRPDVGPDEAAALVVAGALLLDVREPGEWAAGHAPGAVHVPLGALRPDAVPPGRAVVAVCRSGNRSGRAADLLGAAGIPVHNLTGGMRAWAASGRPVVTDAGRPGTVA